MIRYTKLDASGLAAPDIVNHQAVRVDHPLLAQPMIWTAFRSPERMNWQDAKKWAEALTINGWSWRLPTVEEAFLLCDRSRTQYPLVDPAYFPDCDGEWIWTGTEDRTEPAGCAWFVGLDDGNSSICGQPSRGLVRAVRSGQF